MSTLIFTRVELYELVWSVPLTTLAKKYLISDVGLRKICIRMDIPLPQVGHWALVKYNKAPIKIKLPSNFSGEDKITLKIRESGDGTITDSPSEIKTLEQSIIETEGERLIVPERLVHPDKLIIQARNSLTEKLQYYSSHGVRSTHRNELRISVTPGNVPRALRFMDTFVKIIRNRGHEIKINDTSTYIVIQSEDIEISFREKLKRIAPSSPDRWKQYEPTGILTFNAKIHYNNVEWKDGKLSLENQLARIIAKLEIKGEMLRKETLEWEKRRAEQKERERIKMELKERKETELSNFLGMLQSAKQWRDTQLIRNYLNEIEMKAFQANRLSDELKNWLSWARKKADWYDPLVSSPDELLDSFDKHTFTLKEKDTSLSYFN